MNMHGQAIALLDPVDGNRAALRVEERELQLCCRAVLFACDNTAEGVFGFDHHNIAGIDREDRLCIRSVNVVEAALPLDREFMALSSMAFGKAALCHDRGLEPWIVGHRDILDSCGSCKIACPRRILLRSS